MWDIPDELRHYAYARAIALGKSIPVLGKTEVCIDIVRNAHYAPGGKYTYGNFIAQHPPVFCALSAVSLKIGSFFTDNPEVLFRLPRLIAALCGALSPVVFVARRY